jgi:hypothetical protein
MSSGHGFRIPLAALLGLAAALLVSCGSSSDKLIPVASSGPLQSDFETVAQAAEAGNGNCAVTERAILKTEQDFDALPAALDGGLRETLRQGIQNLRARALALCVQPLVQTTPTTSTAKTTTSTATTTPTTTTTSTTTPPSTTPSTTPATTTPGGGTPAPGTGETPGAGGGQSGAPGGGTGAGENGSPNSGANPGEGAAGAGGDGANGQEAAK